MCSWFSAVLMHWTCCFLSMLLVAQEDTNSEKRNIRKPQELSDKIFADVTQTEALLACTETNMRQSYSLRLYFLPLLGAINYSLQWFTSQSGKRSQTVPGFDKAALRSNTVAVLVYSLSHVSVTINTFEVKSHKWLSFQELLCLFHAFVQFQRHHNVLRRGKKWQQFWHFKQLDACGCQKLN